MEGRKCRWIYRLNPNHIGMVILNFSYPVILNLQPLLLYIPLNHPSHPPYYTIRLTTPPTSPHHTTLPHHTDSTRKHMNQAYVREQLETSCLLESTQVYSLCFDHQLSYQEFCDHFKGMLAGDFSKEDKDHKQVSFMWQKFLNLMSNFFGTQVDKETFGAI